MSGEAAVHEGGTPTKGERPLGVRIVRGVAAVLAAIVALGVAFYAFGGMWVRSPEMRAAYEDAVARGEQPPLERRFVVPVPGCLCHSDDPVIQAQHATRRIRECRSCH